MDTPELDKLLNKKISDLTGFSPIPRGTMAACSWRIPCVRGIDSECRDLAGTHDARNTQGDDVVDSAGLPDGELFPMRQ